MLTGADAVSYYGAPRRSEDKDIVVTSVAPDALRRTVAALRREHFEIRNLEPGHNTIFDSGLRIDIKVKSETEETRRISLGRGLRLSLTTPENLVLTKLEFWDGRSFESNDAQDIMKILVRQRRKLNWPMIRREALKRRTYMKLALIKAYLAGKK